jgi:hypothetical protein
MPFKMSSFVFWSGVYNAVLAFFLLFPTLYRALGRDLSRRATLVYWESFFAVSPR